MIRDIATGFVGVLVITVAAAAPTLVTRTAAATIVSRRAPSAQPAARAAEIDAPQHFVAASVPELATPEPEPEPVSPAVKPAVPRRSEPRPKPEPMAFSSESETTVILLRASVATSMDSIAICRRPDGPEGRGVAHATFMGDGTVRVALEAPYAGTSVGACVARRIAAGRIPFRGDPIAMKVAFTL